MGTGSTSAGEWLGGSLSALNGQVLETDLDCEVTRGSGHTLPQGKFQLDRSKNSSSQQEQQSTDTGCLRTQL